MSLRACAPLSLKLRACGLLEDDELVLKSGDTLSKSLGVRSYCTRSAMCKCARLFVCRACHCMMQLTELCNSTSMLQEHKHYARNVQAQKHGASKSELPWRQQQSAKLGT